MNYFHSKKYVNRGEIDASISLLKLLNFSSITPPSLVVHACFPRGRTKSKDVFFDLSRCWPTRGFDLPNLIPHEHGKWTLDASLSTRFNPDNDRRPSFVEIRTDTGLITTRF